MCAPIHTTDCVVVQMEVQDFAVVSKHVNVAQMRVLSSVS